MPCKYRYAGTVLYLRGPNKVARYWDWVTDSAAPSKAKVWDPITGFGGNGNQSSTAWGTNCVLDGPFKDLQLRYWNLDVRPHCLLRVFEPGYPEGGVIEMLGDNYSPQAMVPVNAETTYDGFRTLFENGPHGAVHQGVGGFAGDMGPQLSSPNGMFPHSVLPFTSFNVCRSDTV